MDKTKPIYLDYNATTPIHEEVGKVMMPYLTGTFGNPSSSHSYGLLQKEAVVKSRNQVATLLNCDPTEVTFTSGGTESNNFALRGIYHASKEFYKGRNHIITCEIEHPSVKAVCEHLKMMGARVSYIGVDEFGMLKIKDLEKEISEKTLIVSIMHANNVVGTIQPIKEVSEICKKFGALLHCDAAQSCGKIKIDVKEMGVDLLSLCSHKFYGPPGIGCLYIRKGLKIRKILFGASQESNIRAGTENVIHVVGFGKACELSHLKWEKRGKDMLEMRELLYNELLRLNGGNKEKLIVNGHEKLRLPNTLSVSFPGIQAAILLKSIVDDVAASAGAACHSDKVKVSETLAAMKISEELALGTLRLTVGIYTTKEDILRAAKVLHENIQKLLSN